MNELPPDPPRLRAILAHLERQLTESETIATYLRLQRDAVQAALARAETPPARRRTRLAKGGDRLPALAQSTGRPGFVVQQERTADGLAPATVHVDDCTMIKGACHPIRVHEARVALTDPSIAACAFCRPDTEVGIDLA
ncbi:DUF6233 domain-containing protein [Streptomyces shenzhenensis]